MPRPRTYSLLGSIPVNLQVLWFCLQPFFLSLLLRLMFSLSPLLSVCSIHHLLSLFSSILCFHSALSVILLPSPDPDDFSASLVTTDTFSFSMLFIIFWESGRLTYPRLGNYKRGRKKRVKVEQCHLGRDGTGEKVTFLTRSTLRKRWKNRWREKSVGKDQRPLDRGSLCFFFCMEQLFFGHTIGCYFCKTLDILTCHWINMPFFCDGDVVGIRVV